ncbi:MAG: GntR family transcriptional regulator [Trueperaceae bacterium]|nr:GntR family transcriptional regulator [Trueperaceae bacterium]
MASSDATKRVTIDQKVVEVAVRLANASAAAHVDLAVDKELPTPAYLQLRDKLRGAIDSGAWPVGHALPSERDLALSLALSRMTVRRAFEVLVDDGFVEQRQGSGTYVRSRRLEQTIDRVIGFTDEARLLGFRPGSRTLEVAGVEAEGVVAAALRCDAGSVVLRVVRIRTADDLPLALQVAYLRPQMTTLTAEALARFGSLYRAVAAMYGVTAARARQTIGARLPTPEERSLLDVPAGLPVLALERTTFDERDVPFEYVRSAYRGDRYSLALDLRSPDGG